MADLKCKINIPDVSGLENQVLTVGRHFIFQCRGEWDKKFDFSKAKLELNENEKYFLKLFKAEARDTENFDIDVTTYVAGQISFPQIVLSDGENKLNIGEHKFDVKSVLPKPETTSTQTEQVEQPKPFGYVFGNLHWPILYTLVFLFVFLVIIIQSLRSMLRRKKWNQLKKNIDLYASSIFPEQQFYKSVRSLEKKHYPTQELVKASQIYILRKYQVPLFDLSIKDSERFLKKQMPYNSNHRKLIVNMLKDISHLQTQKNDDLAFKNKFIHKFYIFIEKCEENPLIDEGLS